MPIVNPVKETAVKLVDTYIAGETISALQLIRLDGSQQARVAEPNTTFEEAKVIGMAIGTATAGNEVQVLTFGILDDPFFNFPVNEPLFLATGGSVTDAEPIVGYNVTAGTSLGTGSIFINVREPIQL